MKVIFSLIIVLTLAMSGCTGPGDFFSEDEPEEVPFEYDLTIEDTMYDGNGGRIYLSTNPYYVSSTSGSDQNMILPGGVVIYEAIYNITQADTYTGFIENIVQVSGSNFLGQELQQRKDK